jgi:hypothetical protein
MAFSMRGHDVLIAYAILVHTGFSNGLIAKVIIPLTLQLDGLRLFSY